jgi:preprotein translocase subunit SecB
MPETTEKTRVADYSEFIKSLELYSIGLSSATCDLNRDAYWEKSGEKSITFKLVSKSTEILQKHFDVRSTLTLNVSGEKSKSPALKIAATFDLHFHSPSVSKEFVEKFCESEIRLIVWPYFREYVQDVTVRMYIPPVILPLSNKE